MLWLERGPPSADRPNVRQSSVSNLAPAPGLGRWGWVEAARLLKRPYCCRCHCCCRCHWDGWCAFATAVSQTLLTDRTAAVGHVFCRSPGGQEPCAACCRSSYSTCVPVLWLSADWRSHGGGSSCLGTRQHVRSDTALHPKPCLPVDRSIGAAGSGVRTGVVGDSCSVVDAL